ncbi:MAG TPA: response regulator [Candidatus Thermoplasmatota archaeon]|nr:response regulator [Candidatus Thermoplasmatota archaeon]
MPAGTPKDATLRILLVDDNIDHVQLAMRALRAEPTWRVDTARLGAEAIERAAEEAYDLVLLDYRLPDLTGLEVLQRMRKARGDLAVILMTSQGSEEVAIQALSAGAAGYVVKNADFGRRLAYEVREWAATREA